MIKKIEKRLWFRAKEVLHCHVFIYCSAASICSVPWCGEMDRMWCYCHYVDVRVEKNKKEVSLRLWEKKACFDKLASAVVGANMCLSRAVHALRINLYKLIISHSQRASPANISRKVLLKSEKSVQILAGASRGFKALTGRGGGGGSKPERRLLAS